MSVVMNRNLLCGENILETVTFILYIDICNVRFFEPWQTLGIRPRVVGKCSVYHWHIGL